MQCSVFIATSLDGFIAREDGSLDWLPQGDVEEHGYTEFMAGIDVIVIGRMTYETVLGFDAWPYVGKRVVVLSSRPLAPAAQQGAVFETMSGAPAGIVSQLAARGLRHAYVDGGITVQRFLAAGLIQRLTITRIPVLLGSGIPLFGAVPRDIRLDHVATRSYKSGMVQSEYTIAPSPPSS
jgi:dihydrofolate reductase